MIAVKVLVGIPARIRFPFNVLSDTPSLPLFLSANLSTIVWSLVAFLRSFVFKRGIGFRN
jgi:hypothetical protein